MADITYADTVYILDQLPDECRRIADALADEPVGVKTFSDAGQFFDQVGATASGCVVVPLDLPGAGLPALIQRIEELHLPLAVVVIGRDSEFDMAVELVRLGAFDFLEHPFSDRKLRSVIRKAVGTSE